MKLIFFLIVLLASLRGMAQFEYGTAIVPGSISLTVNTTREEFCNDVLREKVVTNESYSTSLNGIVLWSDDELKMIKMFPPKKGLLGNFMICNNYTKTLPEGATIWDGNDYKIPLYPVTGHYTEKRYGKDPCLNEPECSPDYKTIFNYDENCSGIFSHHGHDESTFRVSIVGIPNCNNFMFVSISNAGTFFENGTMETCFLHGEYAKLKAVYEEHNCKKEWDKHDTKVMSVIEYQPQEDEYSGTFSNDGVWIGSNGIYSRMQNTDEGDGTRYQLNENIRLMRIDTATLFRYIRQRPSNASFPLSGTYESESGDGSSRTKTSIQYQGTLTIGRKPKFLIEAEDKSEYEKWMPGNEDYPESFSPVSFKASFEDKQQKDTISFELTAITHLPGISTNYPWPSDKPVKEDPDIYFAPQDKQTDKNIRILNDSLAVSTKRINQASIVVYSRDFGGHAILKAHSFFAGDVAVCPYDDDYSIEVPNDQNNNSIADAWEKDCGVFGTDKLEDKETLPSGQNREGDGLTAFEEYRGFISKSDVEAPGDGGHTQRKGKHVRTSPVYRDIFIHDADALFSKYGEAANPAGCHWHYLDADQIKLPSVGEVKAVIAANEPDATGDGKAETAFVLGWITKEYRRVNKNSPDTVRNNKQFAMYLLLSPLATSYSGNTIFLGDAGNNSPLQYGHLVVLPQFNSYKKVQKASVEGLIKNSKNNLAAKYPPDVLEALYQTIYEAMVVHEMGHGLGLSHHSHGVLPVKNTKSGEKLTVSLGNLGTVKAGVQYNELFYLDGKEYLITSPEFALNALGVTECCMRYTVEREVDFIDMKVLKKSLQYCKKGKKFTNGDGNISDADDCFGSISIRCINK